MKLTVKLMSLLILLLLASPVILLNSCGSSGSDPLTGGSSGACPDSTAPNDATINPLETSLDAPSTSGGNCYPDVGFVVKDSNGKPMNGICVQVFSNGNIALQTNVILCGNAIANPSSSIVTTTDDSGAVHVELVTLPTTSGSTFFVEAVSGSVTPGVTKTAGATAP